MLLFSFGSGRDQPLIAVERCGGRMTEPMRTAPGAPQWSFYALGAAVGLALVTAWTWGYALLWRIMATVNGWLGVN
jgi:hypothetical protein